MIETIFERARDAHKFEFIMLLKTFRKGDELARRRIAEIAADLVPHLPMNRGRKVSAASAAHEFLLEEAARVTKSEGYTYDEYEKDFTDPLTRATRAEFDDPDFDPRPAHRRFKKRREKAY
jgi:signal recognition particle subunit SEC65